MWFLILFFVIACRVIPPHPPPPINTVIFQEKFNFSDIVQSSIISWMDPTLATEMLSIRTCFQQCTEFRLGLWIRISFNAVYAISTRIHMTDEIFRISWIALGEKNCHDKSLRVSMVIYMPMLMCLALAEIRSATLLCQSKYRDLLLPIDLHKIYGSYNIWHI